ncbi:hypothetical protein, partial [Myroides sp. TSA_177.3]|uniref:hypothetical protein n=1 Tax=Myroides sp. TSA_177.3 TaxID=3415650 RepID=UPI0040456881
EAMRGKAVRSKAVRSKAVRSKALRGNGRMGQWQLALSQDTYRIAVKYGDNESIVRTNGNWPSYMMHIVSQ